MPLETLFSHPNPTVSRSRSLLNRLKNPIGKHSRNGCELEIELENPWKTYFPGEIVKGHVVVTAVKGFDITHLVVALHGYIKVYKNLVVPGDGIPEHDLLVEGKGDSGFEYHGRGLASLFQDEIVLCGAGFLKRQIYKFGFELEFPRRSLPSSIEFEKGTISYIISATITRPTSIAPTTSCFRPIRYKDDIDIIHLKTPRSRTISLEPLSRRGRMRLRHSPSIRTTNTDVAGRLSRTDTDISITSAGPSQGIDPPLSPAPSEDTVGTHTTASSHSFQIVNNAAQSSGAGMRSSDTRSTNTSASAHTIVATTEILRQGALPDDVIPLKISVQHTKVVRGIVIVTLYRQARVDMHPAIPVNSRKGKELAGEEIFPKSRTGLGSLYFSNGSQSGLYRMDLAQTSTVMVVDPQTLTADVSTSIRVPKNTIPTITNVPGDMISFKYYVEIVLDLCGKLGENRFLPSLTSNGPTFTYVPEPNNQLASEWANNILDTSQIRRTKSVVCLRFSLTVGTRDSGRRSQRRQEVHATPEDEALFYSLENGQGVHQGYEDDEENEWDPDEDDYTPHGANYDEQNDHLAPHLEPFPPPEPEEAMDEKTWLKRQEGLLLPSEPPQDGHASGSAHPEFAPSAPFIPDTDLDEAGGLSSPIRGTLISPSEISTRSADTLTPTLRHPPGLAGLDNVNVSGVTEDKQELERRRLMGLASAPPGADTGPEATSGMVPPARASAPVIDEEEEYRGHPDNHVDIPGDHLPVYER